MDEGMEIIPLEPEDNIVQVYLQSFAYTLRFKNSISNYFVIIRHKGIFLVSQWKTLSSMIWPTFCKKRKRKCL
jgi:hypothetical protein